MSDQQPNKVILRVIGINYYNREIPILPTYVWKEEFECKVRAHWWCWHTPLDYLTLKWLMDSHEYRTCPQHVGCSQSQSAILVETPLFAQNGMEFPTFRSLILGFFCMANLRQPLREPFRRSRFSNPLSIS